MKTYQCVNKQTKFYLENEIKSGGEGTILETSIKWANVKGFVAKIYRKEMNEEKIKKLKIMIENPPNDPMSSKGYVSIAWPIDLILDVEENKIVGFLMPKVDECLTLVNVYSRKYRVKKAPKITWSCLHIIAENVATVVDAIHSKGYVIGDIKAENFLVNTETLVVTIVDTDSFQIPGSQGEIYDCQVMTKDYAAPELQNQLFNNKGQNVLRTKEHDTFSLAVLIHYIIFGANPFVKKKGVENSTSMSENTVQDSIIVSGEYFGVSESRIKKRKHLIPPNIVGHKLQIYIRRCFEIGYYNNSFRPTAKQWRTALKKASRELVNCNSHKSHWYNKESGCYWCQALARIDYFPESNKEEIFEPGKEKLEEPEVSISIPFVHPENNSILTTPKIKKYNKVKIFIHLSFGIIFVGLVGVLIYYLSVKDNKEIPVINSTESSFIEENLYLSNEIENFFKSRQKINPVFKEDLQYTLIINRSGKLVSITGMTEKSVSHLKNTRFVKLGSQIYKTKTGKKDRKVTLIINSRGLYKAVVIY